MSDFAPDKCPCGIPWDECPWVRAAFVCPRCGAVSHNPKDACERYCGRCHVFVDDAYANPLRVPLLSIVRA
jgi:hypothetical protein